MKSLFLFSVAFFIFQIGNGQSVVVYPSPATNFAKVSTKFLVSVTQNGVTKQSFVYQSVAGSGAISEWGNEQNNRFHFTTFSSSGPIVVNVTKLNSTATSVVLRPNALALGTLSTVSQGANRSISFSLSKPEKVSVEFNDDPMLSDAMMIFADTLETPSLVPPSSAANVLIVNSTASNLSNIPSSKTIVYFQPGVYSIGLWNIPATIKQIYFAGGAYVMGFLNRNVAGYATGNTIIINGRGILSNEGYAFHFPVSASDNNAADWYFAINLQGGENIMIEGITMIQASSFNIYMHSYNSIIQNVNINGFRYNNDGITIIGLGNKILNCFIRDNDDAIVPYATNLTISNCIFWQLQGSEIQLGWTPHTYSNINISNSYVIHDKNTNTSGDVGFINAMNYTPSNTSADINNITVSNIYFDTPVLRFLDIRADRSLTYSPPLATSPLIWVYRNFSFNNIYLQGANQYPLIYLHGYDATHPLINYTFQNIYLNNIKVTPAKMNDSTFFSQKNTYGIVIK